MDTKNFLRNIIARKKKPIKVELPNDNKNKFKVETNPLGGRMGPEAYLATKNQSSGFETPLKHRKKTKQKQKNELKNINYEE